jgi:hypothetical protein
MSDAAVARCGLKKCLFNYRTTLMIPTAVSHAYGWHSKGCNSKADAHSLLTTNTAAVTLLPVILVSSLQLLQAFGDFQVNVVTVYML